MNVRQHIPAFVEGIEPATAVVSSLPELLALPWVAQWSKVPGFLHYCRGNLYGSQDLLMAQCADAHWVLAYIERAPWLAELPEWKNLERVKDDERPER